MVVPLARAALEQGLDLGMYVAAAASVLAAVVAAVGLRHSGAADAPAGMHVDLGADGDRPSSAEESGPVYASTGPTGRP